MTTLAKPRLGQAQSELTPQQLRFVEEYVLDSSSASKAAIKAGFAEGSAPYYASKLLKDPKIKAALEEIKSQSAERIGITKDRILLELFKIATANVGDLIDIDLSNLSRDQTAALGMEISVNEINGEVRHKNIKVKPLDRMKALELLGKELGMFKDKMEVSGSLTLEQLVEQSMKEDS